MKTTIKNILLLFLVVGLSLNALAQAETEKAVNENEKKDEKKESTLKVPLGLSGKMYLQAKFDTLVDGKEKTTFSLERAYLTYERVLWGPFSFKITSDAGTALKSDGVDSGGDTVTVSGQAYEFFIKNAYLQTAHDWGFLGLNFKFGIIPTPSSSIVGKLQDLRWTYNDYSFDKPKMVGANGDTVSGDTTADLGVSLTTKIFDYVILNYAICHGEGYKHPEEEYDGKAHYGTITIIPFKGINLNGFINYEKDEAHLAYFYYGGGIAYTSSLIKTGANFLIHGEKTSGIKAINYHIIEAWVNFFLGDIVPKVPLIVVGRFAYGKKIENTANFKTLLAGGVGWQFNKHIRLMAYYESYNREGEPGAAAFYIKSEASF